MRVSALASLRHQFRQAQINQAASAQATAGRVKRHWLTLHPRPAPRHAATASPYSTAILVTTQANSDGRTPSLALLLSSHAQRPRLFARSNAWAALGPGASSTALYFLSLGFDPLICRFRGRPLLRKNSGRNSPSQCASIAAPRAAGVFSDLTYRVSAELGNFGPGGLPPGLLAFWSPKLRLKPQSGRREQVPKEGGA